MAQSDTHERVQQNKNASLVHNRAKLVLEIEAFIQYKPSDDTQSPWLQSLLNAARVLLTLPLPCNRMPTVLYVLQPKASGDDDGQNSEWQGRMRVMFRKFDRLELSHKSLDTKLDGNQKGLESKIEDNQKGLESKIEDNNKQLQEGLEQLQEGLESKITDNQKGLEAKLLETKQSLEATKQGLEQKIEKLDAQLVGFQQEVMAGLNKLLAASANTDEQESEPEPEPEPELEPEAEAEA